MASERINGIKAKNLDKEPTEVLLVYLKHAEAREDTAANDKAIIMGYLASRMYEGLYDQDLLGDGDE